MIIIYKVNDHRRRKRRGGVRIPDRAREAFSSTTTGRAIRESFDARDGG